MKRLFFITLSVMLAGCQVQSSRAPELREIIVQNDNSYAVTDFSIRVPATGAVYGCSYIPAGGQCSSRFPARKIANNPPLISWLEQGREYHHQPQGRPLPESSRPYQIFFHIAGGALTIKLDTQ